MKRIAVFGIFLFTLFILVGIVQAKIVFTPGSFDVEIDNLKLTLPAATFNFKGIVMAPARLLSIESGYELKSIPNGYAFFDRFGNQILRLSEGMKRAFAGNETIFLSRPAVIMNNMLYVPVRDVCSYLGISLNYDLVTSKITLIKPKPSITWTDRLFAIVNPEVVVFTCLGVAFFFIVLFFVLTPLRRIKWGKL